MHATSRSGPPWMRGRPAPRRFTGRPLGRDGLPGWPPERIGYPGRRPGRHPHWPGGPVIAATLFHVLGAQDAARAGGVLRPLDALSYGLLLAGPVALVWLRRAPITVLAVASAATIGFATFAEPGWTFAVAPMIALFSAVKAGHRRAAVVVAVVGWVAYLLINLLFADPLGVPVGARPDPRVVVLSALGPALAVVLGAAAKTRQEFRAELASRQAEQARARAEQERRQASEERLRIARELHDVLGHHLSLINVQAGVGLHLMDNRPEQARAALAAIKTASAEALREVRAVLGVLRPEEEAAPRQPAVGLARLDDLTRDAGLVVTTTVQGRARDLPAEVDRAAYRIVQEALTNVRRHATEGAAARVVVEFRDTDVRLTVRNDDAGPPDAGSADAGSADAGSADGRSGGGSGIAGMRARALSLGGTLTAGPLPGGGFEVFATLPTGPSTTGPDPAGPVPKESP